MTPDGAYIPEWGKVKNYYLQFRKYPWEDIDLKTSDKKPPEAAKDGEDSWWDYEIVEKGPNQDQVGQPDEVPDTEQALICYHCVIDGVVVDQPDLITVQLGTKNYANKGFPILYDVISKDSDGKRIPPHEIIISAEPFEAADAIPGGNGRRTTENEYHATCDGAERLRNKLAEGHLYGVYFGENESLGKGYTETTADYLKNRIVSPEEADARYFYTAKQKRELKDSFQNIAISISGLTGAGTQVHDPMSHAVSLVDGTLQTAGNQATAGEDIITWTLDPANAVITEDDSKTKTTYTYRMQYTIQLNQLDGKFHPANLPTELQDSAGQKLIDFPVPGVKAELDTASYTVNYFKDTLDSDPLGTETRSGTIGAQMTYTENHLKPEGYALASVTYPDGNAAGTVTKTPALNVVNVLYMPDTDNYHWLSYQVKYYQNNAEVTGDEILVSEWVPKTQTTLPVNVSEIAKADKYENFHLDHTDPKELPTAAANNDVLKVYYVSNPYNYTVNYFKDTLTSKPLGTETKTGAIGAKMTYTENHLKPEGYALASVTYPDRNAAGTVTKTPALNVVNVLYMPDTDNYHQLSYRVKYYQNNAEVTGDEILVSEWVPKTQTTLPVNVSEIAKADKYENFHLDHTDLKELPTAAANNDVLKVYYVSDTHELKYMVKYFKGEKEVTGDRLTYSKVVPVSQTMLPVSEVDTSNNRYSGYKFSWTDPAPIPAYITNGGVIEVHYRKVSSPPPDPRLDPPMLNTKDHYSYIIGYKDGLLRPTGAITRGEVATIFFRLLTDETRDKYWCQVNDYTDVPADLWCCNAISTLSNIGIISGFQDGSFRHEENITRAQFTKMAVNFFETREKDYQGIFIDVPDDAWFTEYVESAASIGLVNGFHDGSFRPYAPITRAEACVIINRAIGRKPYRETLLPRKQMITWPDNTPDLWFYADMQEATNSHDYTMTRDEVEKWTGKLPQRNWALLEREWSDAHSARGGQVIDPD